MKNRMRKEFTFSKEIGAAPEAVFPLLCPVREYEWIERWQCEMIYSASGVAELDVVFSTDFPEGGHEVWEATRFEPPSRIEFVRMGPWFTVRYRIGLEALAGGRTRLSSHQIFTALNDEGEARLAVMDQAGYERRNGGIWTMLDHYLRTGKMLREAELA